MSARDEQFHSDAARAAENWRAVGGEATPGSVYVQAEAKTGSKYIVAVAKLPDHPDIPGSHVVSIIQPWQTAWLVTLPAEIELRYAMERFRNPARQPNEVHGGDLQAIAMTINYALSVYDQWTAEEAAKEVTK